MVASGRSVNGFGRLDQLVARRTCRRCPGGRRDAADSRVAPGPRGRPGEDDVAGARALDECDLARFGRTGSCSTRPASRRSVPYQPCWRVGPPPAVRTSLPPVPPLSVDRHGQARVDRDPVVGLRAVDDDRVDVGDRRLVQVDDAVDGDLDVAVGLGDVDRVRGRRARPGQGGDDQVAGRATSVPSGMNRTAPVLAGWTTLMTMFSVEKLVGESRAGRSPPGRSGRGRRRGG